MRSSFAPLALAAFAAANPVPQGVTEDIAPSTASPPGCSPDFDGSFQIEVVNVTSSSNKRSFEKRQAGALIITLSGGVLKDAKGRTGYIADNRQFQFDGPAQNGALYTAGWSICQNKTLAIGGDAVFQQCLSGTFYNLYDENDAAQCSDVHIQAINIGNAAPIAPVKPAATPVQQIPDGQPQAVSQIGDGQIQAPTGAPVTQIGDGQIQAPTGAPVSQIADGQIQAPTGAPVTQIADGQIQAPTGAPVTQIADGQIQAPTGAPVTQIADGQIQAPTGAPVTQIPDGQIQAPTAKPVAPVAPINGTVPAASPSIQPYTGAASLVSMRRELFGLAAGVLAVAML